MRVFERLRALRAFEQQHLHFLSWGGDHRLIGEIGHYQTKGTPLSLKQLFLLDVGSVATVQRHLRRFKELGLVHHRRAAGDRRAVELTLSAKCLRIFAKYGTLMSPTPLGRGSGKPSHVCGLCDSDADLQKLLVTFLAQGMKRGDKCVLLAPAETQDEILAALPDRRTAPRHLVVSEGHHSADAQFAFLKRLAGEAKQAGRTMRLAADMSWALSRNFRIDTILDSEMQFDALARKFPVTALCVYDARRYSSGDFLRAVKCHRDHARYPIMMG